LRKVGTPVLEAPEKAYAPRTGPAAGRQSPRRVSKGPSLRRDTSEDFARPETDADGFPRPRGLHFRGLRFRLKGGVPTSMVGRVVAGTIVLGGLAAFTAVIWEARSALLHDPRLVIPSSSSIQIVGNEHLTRPQLLSVFGDDVDRNILTVSLEDRKASLETLPWVEHATVMRLLPNKLRIAIVERTPVAYVRHGSHIGLVDAHGVLLDMSPEAATRNDYSFPVVTGISADDPLSTRAARMALFTRFMTDLDAGGEKVTDKLSEVDLSSPEDVKALIPSGPVSGKMADILVHFGDDDFLARYQRYQQKLPEWLTQYPRLASADMRYERQVVLEMAKGATVEEAQAPAPAVVTAVTPAKPAAKHGVAAKPVKKAARPISKQGRGR
jgi:cell division protein FtsQ